MKFSIITPSYNQGRFIKDTIESVLSQNYNNFEHIIIDGGSTDETIEVLRSYPHLKWISEKDNGAASAINKGFKMATGDILSWINADDYYENYIFEYINSLFEKDNIRFLYGNLTIVDEYKNILIVEKTSRYEFDYLVNVSSDIIRQPSTFFSKEIIAKIGGVDESLKLVFDYDLIIRLLKECTPYYVDKNLSYYRDHESTLTRQNFRTQAKEIYLVSRRNGGKLFSPINKSNLRKYLFPDSIYGIRHYLKTLLGLNKNS